MYIKHFAFVFLLASFFSFSKEDSLQLEDVIADMKSNEVLEWAEIDVLINKGIEDEQAEAYFIKGYVHFFGIYNNTKDLKTSTSYLKKAVAKNYQEARFYLGTVLLEQNEPAAVDVLLELSKEGDIDAIINLYQAYKKGLYKDQEKLKALLTLASDAGDDEAAICYGRLVLNESININDSGAIINMIKYLSVRAESKGFSNDMYKHLYYHFFTVYSLPRSPLKNEKYSKYYLKQAAENGHEHAIKLIKQTNLWLEQ